MSCGKRRELQSVVLTSVKILFFPEGGYEMRILTVSERKPVL